MQKLCKGDKIILNDFMNANSDPEHKHLVGKEVTVLEPSNYGSVKVLYDNGLGFEIHWWYDGAVTFVEAGPPELATTFVPGMAGLR